LCSFSYDHELKIQKARENARRTEKEKEAERNDSLMHEFLVRNKFIIKQYSKNDSIQPFRIIYDALFKFI